MRRGRAPARRAGRGRPAVCSNYGPRRAGLGFIAAGRSLARKLGAGRRLEGTRSRNGIGNRAVTGGGGGGSGRLEAGSLVSSPYLRLGRSLAVCAPAKSDLPWRR